MPTSTTAAIRNRSGSSSSASRHRYGKTHGLPIRERRDFTGWRPIGTITFDEAVASYNGDHVIHFNHPPWRDDRNDPSTVRKPKK